LTNVYSADFFANQQRGSLDSAKVILPLLIDVFRPRSLLDVGCGQGTWSQTALDHGIADLLGVDGEWARPVLKISESDFRSFDLAAPFDLGRRFDLAISMEVGEHIDPAHADSFVGNLVRHSDAVVFSAAVPFQGGIHHVNEQWPPYWVEKFARENYRCFDFLRWRIWNDDRIETWYRQNLLIFANRRNSDLIARLDAHAREQMPAGCAVIHPEMWTAMMNSKSLRLQRSLSPALKRIGALLPSPKTAPKRRRRPTEIKS
jgi:SAM-dependent methyltransferase